MAARPAPGDPLAASLVDGAAPGLLAIDLATRRRVRVNGTLRGWTDDGVAMETDKVFGNCQQYIQRRTIVGGVPEAASVAPRRTATLAPGQRALIAADTSFIASAHPTGGADASHRRGNPGFVRVVDERTLAFPDYPGNTMFQTLGDLAANPRCGLLLIDFASGATLQLSGTADIVWDRARVAGFAGAERAVEVRIAEVIRNPATRPFSGRSPPPLSRIAVPPRRAVWLRARFAPAAAPRATGNNRSTPSVLSTNR